MEENTASPQQKNEPSLKKKTFKYQAFLGWDGLLTIKETKDLFPGVEIVHPELFIKPAIKTT